MSRVGALDRDRAGSGLGSTLVLFALALGLRALHVFELQGGAWADERAFVSDSAYYDQSAREIAGGELVGDSPGFLSPLYCLFLGGVYALAGPSLLAAKLAQAFLGALSVALVHRAGRLVFGEPAGALAALLLALNGVLVYYTGLLLPDGLVLFWHALFLWLCVRRPPFGWNALAAGSALGLATATKANALLLLLATLVWVLAAFRDHALSARVRAALLLLAGAALAVFPITLQNYLATDRLVLVTTTGGRNLLKGNGPEATGTHTQLSFETVNIGHYLDREVDVDQVLREDRELGALALETMAEDPLRAARLFGVKLLLFFNAMELGIRDDYAYARTQSALLALPLVPFALVAPLGLAGLCLFAFADRRATLVTVVLATQVASFVLVFVLARYRLPAIAALALFAGAALSLAASDLRARRFLRPALTALIAAASLFLVHLDVPGFERPASTAKQHAFVGDFHFRRGDDALALVEYEAALAQAQGFRSSLDALVLRARVADCLEGLGLPDRAELVRAEVQDELARNHPQRSAALQALLLAPRGAEREPRASERTRGLGADEP